MSRCLPSLITKLSNRSMTDPIHLVNSYEGTDWQHISCLYPVTIWENEYMKLYLRNWNQGEHFLYKNNYSTVHSKVLKGSFLSKMTIHQNKIGISINKQIYKKEFYTFKPFSDVLFTSIEPSVTLQLYYYHHLY